jgi:hypothetical protein
MKATVIECRRQFIDKARKSLKTVKRNSLKEKAVSLRLPILQTFKKDEIIEAIAIYWWEKKIREEGLFVPEPEIITVRVPATHPEPEFLTTLREYSSWAASYLDR